MIAQLPLDVLRIAIPLVVYFVVTFFASAWLAYRLGADYPRMASIAFTATGNNFELTIAVAAATRSGWHREAFAAVVRPLIEVPALILLVNASLGLGKRWYGVPGAAGDRVPILRDLTKATDEGAYLNHSIDVNYGGL